jgi:pimeloyl-ACP methyl ester carboxylesterase
MQTLHVNGYDMAYLDVGKGPPLVCVHGSLSDFRIWGAVIGPLSARRRVIGVSLRHFFPEHWDGVGDTYSIAQHVQDVIAFIEKLGVGPADLMGHSRGGHISFRVAQRRPDLVRKLILPSRAASSTQRSIPNTRAGHRSWRSASRWLRRRSPAATSTVGSPSSWMRWKDRASGTAFRQCRNSSCVTTPSR